MAGNDNKTAMSGNQRCNCMERHQQTFYFFLIDGKTILENENWLKGSFGNTWNYRQGQVLKTMSEGGDAMCQQTATIEAILKFFLDSFKGFVVWSLIVSNFPLFALFVKLPPHWRVSNQIHSQFIGHTLPMAYHKQFNNRPIDNLTFSIMRQLFLEALMVKSQNVSKRKEI